MNVNRLPLILLPLLLLFSEVRAQTPQVLAGNLLNGALTGTMLGAATMGLQNSDDFSALRIGVGAGILGGATTAVYDLATLPRGEQLYVSGVFNDGYNSSILILLDTFYGAASGAVVGVAGMLISDRPIVVGLQYGSGIGAWAGFGFGLLDAFVLAERNRDLILSRFLERESLLAFHSEAYRLKLIRPSLYIRPHAAGNELTAAVHPALDVVSFRMSF